MQLSSNIDSPVIRVGGRIIVTQLLSDLGQLLVLPADQDVAAAGVVLHQVLDTLGVLLRAGRIDSEPQFLGERKNRLVRAVAFAICESVNP